MTGSERIEVDSGFRSKLRELLPRPCIDRPFECNGLPQTCDVMLIGENPATDLGEDWWRHWSDTEGCDKNAAKASYIAARVKRKEEKRAEGKRVRLISPTHTLTEVLDTQLRAHGSRLLVTSFEMADRREPVRGDWVRNHIL